MPFLLHDSFSFLFLWSQVLGFSRSKGRNKNKRTENDSLLKYQDLVNIRAMEWMIGWHIKRENGQESRKTLEIHVLEGRFQLKGFQHYFLRTKRHAGNKHLNVLTEIINNMLKGGRTERKATHLGICF